MLAQISPGAANARNQDRHLMTASKLRCRSGSLPVPAPSEQAHDAEAGGEKREGGRQRSFGSQGGGDEIVLRKLPGFAIGEGSIHVIHNGTKISDADDA